MDTLETIQDMLMKEYALGREQLAPEATLAGIGLDSLGMIEMMMQVEDRFGITLPEDVPPAMVNVGDLVAYIDGLLSASPAPLRAKKETAVTPSG
jgi:acyl carrier protein